MPEITPAQKTLGEPQLVALAREIAMDIMPIETILRTYGINQTQFETIQKLSRFQHLLAQQAEIWQSAMNTNERVKAKAAAALEDWLPELHARLHDRSQTLTAQITGGQLLAKLAGLGLEKAEANTGPGFHLEIHIGDGSTRVVDVTPKVSQPLELEATAHDDEDDA
jgi:hypothetical protein